MVGTFYIPFYFPFGGSKHFFFLISILYKLEINFFNLLKINDAISSFFFPSNICILQKEGGKTGNMCLRHKIHIYRQLEHPMKCHRGFPDGASGKEPACQCRRHKRCRFDPWVRKIPWRRAWHSTPVFLPGESMDKGAWWVIVHKVTESTEVT